MVDAGKYTIHVAYGEYVLNIVSNYTWPQTKVRVLLSLKIGRAPKRKDRLPPAIFQW